jgi:P4 family phage/plasmid primase-like protien
MLNQYKEFLVHHDTKKTNGVMTHTRIGNPDLKIYGGVYTIGQTELQTFIDLYYDHVFVKKNLEHLTEKQLQDTGALLVDFDFRYEYEVESRLHTKNHIIDMIALYLDEIKNFYDFTNFKPFNVYIFEKPNVNRLKDGSLTKDGIHMIIGVQMDHICQLLLRDKIIERLPKLWDDLPLTNDYKSVLDEGISKGTTNWQLYGSRKPGNESYELTLMIEVVGYDVNDGEFISNEKTIKDFDFKKNLIQLSAQFDNHPKFDLNQKIINEYNKKRETKKEKKPSTKIKLLVDNDNDNDNDNYNVCQSYSEITNAEKLKKTLEFILKNIKTDEYHIRETHEYTQILPAKYYDPGSHLLNRQVAFALKHTDERLFLSWIMLRSKAHDFDYSTITELHVLWKSHFNNDKNSVVTRKSIMYWAKQDAFDEYIKVKNNTVDYCVEESINTFTDYDFAKVLYQLYKDKYVCSDINSKSWHEFKEHRWVANEGSSIRLAISNEMHTIYQNKRDTYINEMQHYEESENRYEFLKKRTTKIGEVCIKLKTRACINNIYSIAVDIFYDNDFIKKMDSNAYLMCFLNGVIDFKNKEFRDGCPQDYITKTTGICYLKNFKEARFEELKEQIKLFMEQLFPNKDLNRYMWQHLASCLIGENINQTFNMYIGSGSNGKSLLIDLMSKALGEYKGNVPLPLITDKRTSIGGTSSEVMQLKGIRYAVMSEPSKGTRINEGVLKELTGGDPIQARGLYKNSETFILQCALVACTNVPFDMNNVTDDGTWRRFRWCDFEAKFVEPNEKYNTETQFVFPKDKKLKEKLPKWAPVFVSMLVEIAFDMQGHVEPCSKVLESTDKYRQSEDYISGFLNALIIHTRLTTDKIKKKELEQEFKIWFESYHGNEKKPKGKELYDLMDKQFGKFNSKGYWSGVKINYPLSEEQEDNLNQLS